MNKKVLITASVITSISIISPAHAYLDPGTGSLLLQGLIAGIALAISTAKLWWYKITLFFKRDTVSLEDPLSQDPPQSNTISNESNSKSE